MSGFQSFLLKTAQQHNCKQLVSVVQFEADHNSNRNGFKAHATSLFLDLPKLLQYVLSILFPMPTLNACSVLWETFSQMNVTE